MHFWCKFSWMDSNCFLQGTLFPSCMLRCCTVSLVPSTHMWCGLGPALIGGTVSHLSASGAGYISLIQLFSVLISMAFHNIDGLCFLRDLKVESTMQNFFSKLVICWKLWTPVLFYILSFAFSHTEFMICMCTYVINLAILLIKSMFGCFIR